MTAVLTGYPVCGGAERRKLDVTRDINCALGGPSKREEAETDWPDAMTEGMCAC
jgi:hypothetical protein